MITTKEDYIYFLKKDKAASLRGNIKFPETFLRATIYKDYIWKYHKVLRKTEYYLNCQSGIVSKLCSLLYRVLLHNLQYRTGIFIPPNTTGPGLYLPHYGPIIINNKSKIGENCIINIDTIIGGDLNSDCPEIGNNVTIEAGVRIFGNIKIADNIVIGVNSVVNRSFLEEDITIAGVPARKIKDKGRSIRKEMLM